MKELDELRDRYHKGTRDLLEPQQSLLVLETLAAEQERLGKRVEALEGATKRVFPVHTTTSPAPAHPLCPGCGYAMEPGDVRCSNFRGDYSAHVKIPAPAEPSEEDVEWLSDVYQGASLHRSTRAREALRALISRGWTPPRKP